MYLNLISLKYTAKMHGIESGQIFKCWAYLQDCEIRNPTAQKKKETNSQIPGPLCRLRKGVSFCSVSLQLLSKSSPSRSMKLEHFPIQFTCIKAFSLVFVGWCQQSPLSSY